jgi:hypothetical protein
LKKEFNFFKGNQGSPLPPPLKKTKNLYTSFKKGYEKRRAKSFAPLFLKVEVEVKGKKKLVN